jgi:cytoskeletal protein CcmA (bactofilin family)
MKHKWTFIILVLAALSLTGCLSTSFSGDYTVKSGTTLQGDLFVTEGIVTLEQNSRVTGTIMLTSGQLRIGRNAQVSGNVVLTSGDVYMADGAVVHGDVILSSEGSSVIQAPTSRIEGRITHDIAPYAISTTVKIVLLCCVLPIVILVILFLVLGVWLCRITRRKPQVVQAPAPVATEDVQQKLEKLKSLLDQGLISQTDYEAKKADILSKM